MTTIREIRIMPQNKSEQIIKKKIAEFEDYVTAYQWAMVKLKADKGGCFELDFEYKHTYVFDLDKEKFDCATKNGLELLSRERNYKKGTIKS